MPNQDRRNPFLLSNADAYRSWRDWKLARKPASASQLIVEVKNLAAITKAERAAMLDRLQRANMVIYACKSLDHDPETALHRLASCFGMRQLDAHLCAEEDRITPISTEQAGDRKQRYIPYTDKPINWHTDGYYNAPDQRVRAFILHCVRAAKTGGENAFIDPEIAYIRLRDDDPAHVEALSRNNVMSIPPNEEDGTEIRAERSGPVFWVDPNDGTLGMRYTARTRSISWSNSADVKSAIVVLKDFLNGNDADVLRHRLAPGQGTLTNNILHNRTGFADRDQENMNRLIYRARYYDRVADTGLTETWLKEYPV